VTILATIYIFGGFMGVTKYLANLDIQQWLRSLTAFAMHQTVLQLQEIIYTINTF